MIKRTKGSLWSALFAAIFMTMLFASCNDSKTEQMLDGTWECTKTEREDGMTMRIKETITYDAATHRYESELKMSGEGLHLFTVSYSGTWSVTQTKVLGEPNPKSLTFDYISNVIDKSDREEMKREFRKEMENDESWDGGEIMSLTEDELVLRDEEDNETYTYRRIN